METFSQMHGDCNVDRNNNYDHISVYVSGFNNREIKHSTLVKVLSFGSFKVILLKCAAMVCN